MKRSALSPNAVRVMIVFTGFVAGFFVMAGLYGFVFPGRLIDRGLDSIQAAYLASAGLLSVGLAGFYVRRYARRRLASGP